MRQINNYGDERQYAWCAYCGGSDATEDHVPPKVFLDKPYPENLHIVRACGPCNNESSKDEEYVACLIDCALAGSTAPAQMLRPKVSRILRDRLALTARLSKAKQETTDGGVHFEVETDRVRALALKLARGHALYDLNEPKFDDPVNLWVTPLANLTVEQRAAFEAPPVVRIWPEVGSRAMGSMLGDAPDRSSAWTVVQPQRYRYVAIADSDVTVRIVLSEYVASEVRWS